MTLTELCALTCSQVTIRNRPEFSDPEASWYACIDGAEKMDDGMLVGVTGNGPTPFAALVSYVRTIRGAKMCIQAGGPNRREFVVPLSLVLGFEEIVADMKDGAKPAFLRKIMD